MYHKIDPVSILLNNRNQNVLTYHIIIFLIIEHKFEKVLMFKKIKDTQDRVNKLY